MRALGAATLLIAGCAAADAGPAPDRAADAMLELHVTDSFPCRFEHDGRSMRGEELKALTRTWPGRPRRSRLTYVADSPYRCVFTAIYWLQRADFTVIDMAEPLPPG